MKSCAVTDAKLGDHFDRRLPLKEAQQLDRHLDECADCRKLYQRLITLRILVDGLVPSIEPDRDLWPEIAVRLFGAGDSRPGNRRRRFYWTWMVISAAAATLLIAVGVSEWFDRSERSDVASKQRATGDTAPLDDSLRVEVAKAEQAYTNAAGDFLAQLESVDGDLPPETKLILQGNLLIADRAISEVKSAWELQPSNFALARKLLEAHERRVELLQQVTHLSFATQNGG